MSFDSILFLRPSDRAPEEKLAAPDCFRDLNLDQIVTAIAGGKDEYTLTPFFYMPLHDVDAVHFRHEVIRDLEIPVVFEQIKTFAKQMHTVREYLAQADALRDVHQKERWVLDAVEIYGDAVQALCKDLGASTLQSRGLRGWLDYLREYTASTQFTSLTSETRKLQTALAAIRYEILIHGPRVEVRPYSGAADYSAEVSRTFERFRQGAVQRYVFGFNDPVEMNHIESQILQLVADMESPLFAEIAQYRAKNKEFLDPTVVAFDREIQFYVAYLDYIPRFRQEGLALCYPEVSDTSKEFRVTTTYDVALARTRIGTKTSLVTNDFYLEGPERILVISGPNQGGKTTAARTFGQLHYLASLGYLVPGTEAHLYLPDRIFTHFEREERMTNLRGKLEDDLMRIHQILQAATPRSVIIINEIFASTTLRDAIFLSKEVATAIMALDVLCLWVTFIDEVSSLSEKTVSMVTTVVADNPAQRTFKVMRRPADGLAYAMAIAEKYRLTYTLITERLAS